MAKIYTTYPEAWDTMLGDCRAAQAYIYFEQFIWQDIRPDGVGGKFLEVFKQKAAEGVRVKILVDAVGSIALTSKIWLQKEITDAGIELEIFGLVPRWQARFPFNLFHRDHRKLLIIDDKIAHVSGVIVGERASDWRDIGLRITDPDYVHQVKGAFLRLWDEVRGTREYVGQYDVGTELLLKNDPENNDLYKEILRRVRQATERISIVTPYFSPDWKMMRALRKARRRGVHVELVLPRDCDSPLTKAVAKSYVRGLLRSKIEVYHFHACMNHGKLVMVDGWTTIGSMNFDRLSFFYNRELNVVFADRRTQFETLVEDFKKNADKLDKSYFRNRGFWFWLQVWIGKLLRPIA